MDSDYINMSYLQFIKTKVHHFSRTRFIFSSFILLIVLMLPVMMFMQQNYSLRIKAATGIPIKLMPLGDSITEGWIHVPGAYRIKLYPMLQQAGDNIDFVGSLQDGPAELTDRDHEGHSGWRIDEIRSGIDGWLSTFQPDIVLLHIGTNDILQQYDLPNAPARLQDLVNRICQDRPGVQIVVASIIPRPGLEDSVNAYNAQVPGVVQNAKNAGCKATFIDMYSVLTGDDLDESSTHPTRAGYDKMADAWFPVVQSIYTGTNPATPTPTPNAPAPTLTPNSFRDDFTSTTLGSGWTFTNAAGNASFSLTQNPGHLQISVPQGSAHDCWVGTLLCARMLRPVDSGDAVYETKIDGQTIGTAYQTYGIMLWQNNTNFMRFEFWTDGYTVYANAYKIINNVGSLAIGSAPVVLGQSNALRVTKAGNNYTFQYSLNGGSSWSTVGTFAQANFPFTQAGLYVINSENNPQTIANFDYFQRSVAGGASSPTPTIVSPTPTKTPTPVPPTPTKTPTPTLPSAPTPTPTKTPTPTPTTAAGGFSDDFGSGTLGSGWTFTDPVGNSSYSLSALAGHLRMTLPSGTVHDCWVGVATCTRMMRSVANGNAVYTTKIDGNALVTAYQSYGILLWQNSSNFMRFEFWTEGSGVKATIHKVINNVGNANLISTPVTLGSSNLLRVTRTASNYKFEFSTNGGASYSPLGTVIQSGFAPVQVGMVVSNAGATPATSANFDSFSILPQ